MRLEFGNTGVIPRSMVARRRQSTGVNSESHCSQTTQFSSDGVVANT
jgi:hypothetical protein